MTVGASSWRLRFVTFALGGGATLVGGVFSVLRTKWLAEHLMASGLGVLTQAIAAQNWLGAMTGLGLGIPVARAVGRACAQGDAGEVRRALWTAIGLVLPAAAAVVALGLAFAPAIAVAVTGSADDAALVRIAMIGVAGLAFQAPVLGLFAGHSDVRAPLTLALAGGSISLAATLALVPRFALEGGMLGAALLAPAGVAGALWVHRRRYAAAWHPPAAPRWDLARGFLAVAAVALGLSLLEQGTMLALRSHYLRVHGVAATGLLHAGLALSQQLGGLFYAYLASYAFGRVSGAAGAGPVRDYTRRLWTPLLLAALAACGAALLAAGPLLDLLYSRRFADARPLLAWTLVGEFARIALQILGLGALVVGGVRLWAPLGIAQAASLALAYAAAHGLGAGAMSLPYAYAAGAAAALGFAAAWMARRGVTPGARGGAFAAAAMLALAALAARA